MAREYKSLVVLLLCLIGNSNAKSVIGFAANGAVSHQAAFARLGLELVERGHNFAMLVSAGDTLTRSRFAKAPFQSLRQILYSGPPELGTDEWLKSLERAPEKVRLSQHVAPPEPLLSAQKGFGKCLPSVGSRPASS